MGDINADITREKGFRLGNDMHVCTWMGQTCTELDFTHSFSTYGNCYTFNASPENPINQTIPGSGYGLSVMIDIKSHLYTENPLLPGGTADVGLKLLVHDQNEPPKMDTQGIAVAPGSHAYIAIRQIQYQNHIPPWGVCQDLQLEYYDTYTLTGCQLECRSKYVVQNCTCRPIYLPGDVPYCEPADVAHCVRPVEVHQMADTKMADTKMADTKMADTKMADTKMADTKMADTKMADTKMADTKMADTKMADTKMADTKMADTKMADTKMADTKMADTKMADTKMAAS
ncbi:sodium channel [Branchiostoma belcheri]|nr:sodium channel [Branchiostoma belcheri]